MRAWLKHLDASTMRSQWVRLPAPPASFSIGRAPGCDLLIGDRSLSPEPCQLLSHDGAWRVAGGPLIDGRASQRLGAGDTFCLGDHLFVFLPQAEARNEALEAAIDVAPFDPERLAVWADWLQERGDPLGEQLATGQRNTAALEGLGAFERDGQLELTLESGLPRAATVRATPRGDVALTLARLLSLRAARWLQALTVDATPWDGREDPTLEARLLRLLLDGGPRPNLSRLSLGYATGANQRSSFVAALVERLATRFPNIDIGALRPSAEGAALEILATPAGTQVVTSPGKQTHLDLADGLWAGGASASRLTLLPPGVRRTGVHERFLISAEPPRWHLKPLEPNVRLNGRATGPAHLLPGDEVSDATGARFRFVLKTRTAG